MSTKKKKHHRGPRQQKRPLLRGDGRKTVVTSKDGSYVRVQLEYKTHAQDEAGLADRLAKVMYDAARTTDLRTVASQRPDDIVEGEILTPDGTFVVESWIPEDKELLILKGRSATVEDLATLERYGEPEDEKFERITQAKQILADREAQVMLDSVKQQNNLSESIEVPEHADLPVG